MSFSDLQSINLSSIGSSFSDTTVTMSQFSFTVVVFAILLVAINSYAFWGSTVSQRNSLSNGFVKYSNAFRSSKVGSQMTSSSSSYTSTTPSELFAHILSDEEEEEEPEAPPATTDAPAENSEGMSTVKEGIMFPTTLNGSDVRVGIIMARWNSDIIAGLYKVLKCALHRHCRPNYHS